MKSQPKRNLIQFTRLSPESGVGAIRPILLGHWCLPRTVAPWQMPPAGLESEIGTILTYHWDEPGKLNADMRYLDELVSRIRLELRERLNEIHGVQESQRYWDIVCGWWLHYFTQIFWDRWESIRVASELVPNPTFIPSDIDEPMTAPGTIREFIDSFQEDTWNQQIFELIASQHFGWTPTMDLGRVSHTKRSKDHDFVAGTSLRTILTKARNFPTWALRKVNSLLILNHESSHFATFWADNLSMFDRLRISSRFKEWPRGFRQPQISLPRPSPRGRAISFEFPRSRFETALAKAIQELMPVAYLEGLGDLLAATRGSGQSKGPSLLITGVGHYVDDIYCVWVAERIASGSRLVILQHGGTYGIAERSSSLDYDNLIADGLLSWGWSGGIARPSSSTKLMKLRRARTLRQRKSLLIVGADLFRYSHHLTTTTLPSQQYRVFQDIGEILAGLPDSIVERTRLRILTIPSGLSAEQHLIKRFPKLSPTNKGKPFQACVRESRLVLCTDNSTTMIESMYLDTPTVIYWEPSMNSLSERGQVAMNLLRSVGIFHDDIESALNHIINVWHSPNVWWKSQSTQTAIAHFLKEFGHVGSRPHQDLTDSLLSFFPAK